VSSLPRPPGLGEIEFKVEREDERTAVYVIEGEDHTIGNLLEKILINMKGVDFANYEMPHPLEHRIVIRIHTDGSITPREALKKALDEALELIKSFRELFLKELQRLGREIEE
jgi:DNA-directed RNA polymerase subunit L